MKLVCTLLIALISSILYGQNMAMVEREIQYAILFKEHLDLSTKYLDSNGFFISKKFKFDYYLLDRGCNYRIVISSLAEDYPKSIGKDKLFEVEVNKLIGRCGDLEFSTFQSHIEDNPLTYLLIGVDTVTKDIHYYSGNVVQHRLMDKFQPSDLNELRQFYRLKLYDIKAQNIEIEIEADVIFVTCWSAYYRNVQKFKGSITDPDILQRIQ